MCIWYTNRKSFSLFAFEARDNSLLLHHPLTLSSPFQKTLVKKEWEGDTTLLQGKMRGGRGRGEGKSIARTTILRTMAAAAEVSAAVTIHILTGVATAIIYNENGKWMSREKMLQRLSTIQRAWRERKREREMLNPRPCPLPFPPSAATNARLRQTGPFFLHCFLLLLFLRPFTTHR